MKIGYESIEQSKIIKSWVESFTLQKIEIFCSQNLSVRAKSSYHLFQDLTLHRKKHKQSYVRLTCFTDKNILVDETHLA